MKIGFGYTLHAPQDSHAEIIPPLRSMLCRHLNLCASVGCSCVTGAPEPSQCFESDAGQRFPSYHSEGPTWSISIRTLPQQIIIDIALADELIKSETWALYQDLIALNYPIAVHSIIRV